LGRLRLTTDQGRDVLIVKGFAHFCWFLVKWGLLPGAIAAIVALPYVYRQVDEGIRGQIESQIAEHYADLTVTVRSAARVEGQGIEVRGLSIFDSGASGPSEAIAHLEEVFFCCTTDLADLLIEDVVIGRITIRRPTLRIVRRADGTWNTDRFFPLPKLGRRAPEVLIENGTVEILDPTRQPAARLVLRDVNMQITPAEDGPSDGRVRKLHGVLTADHLRRIEFEGTIDPQSPGWSIAGVVEDLMVSPELCDALPAPVAAAMANWRGFRGRAGAAFRVQSGSAPGEPYRFDVSAQITQGRLDDPRLPCPLTDVVATVQANNDGFAVRNLSARGGESTVWLDVRRAGYTPDAPWSLAARLRRIELGPQLMAKLPANMQLAWRKYWPSGLVDVDVALASDGRRLLPEATEVTVRCLGVAFTYHKFPYRMERAEGTLVLKNDVLSVDDMTAYTGDCPVAVSARVWQPLSDPFGWMEAKGHNVPLDQKLADALSAVNREHSESLAKLHLEGTCDFWLRVGRDAPGAEATQHFIVRLNDCAVCFEGFPYPLEKIRGRIERLPDRNWTFTDLVGTNDTGRVTLAGCLTTAPEGRVLAIRLEGKNVPLDEDLRDALRPAMQQVWDDLAPRGFVDLGADIEWLVDQKKLNLTVLADPQPETASIEPKAFPYRMEQIRGRLVYRDGHVSFDRVWAKHGQVQLSCNGSCEFLSDGSWRLHLGDVAVDRLCLDRELIQALPSRLRRGLVRLDPRGPMYLHQSAFDLWHTGRLGEPVRAGWDLVVGFQQASIDCGVLLENMHGDVRLAGQFDGEHFESRGELAIESLTFRGFQFTEVAGPLSIDDARVLFGSYVVPGKTDSAAAAESSSPRPITARLFGGVVRGDAWIALEDVPRYSLSAQLAQADLRLLAKETMPGQQDLRGRLGGDVKLWGQGLTVHGLGGKGQIWLREADVYELPVMVSLLKILSMSEPNRTAFSSADVGFTVSGPHVHLSPIDFKGDAISLLGKGEMDFDSNIDLAFYAVVGRDVLHVPLVSPIGHGVSQRTMTLKVGGTLQDPHTSRQVLPGVKEALARLQADLQGPALLQGGTNGHPRSDERSERTTRR